MKSEKRHIYNSELSNRFYGKSFLYELNYHCLTKIIDDKTKTRKLDVVSYKYGQDGEFDINTASAFTTSTDYTQNLNPVTLSLQHSDAQLLDTSLPYTIEEQIIFYMSC